MRTQILILGFKGLIGFFNYNIYTIGTDENSFWRKSVTYLKTFSSQ